MTRADSAWWRTADPIISVVLGRFGRLDIPVNNAGMFISKPFSDYTTDDYATVSEVNLARFFWLTQRAIAEMVSRYGGHVVKCLGHHRRGHELRHARGAGRADQG
jgi:NADP-dependent 3-hydroxy acid dehydrogenase YdfG